MCLGCLGTYSVIWEVIGIEEKKTQENTFKHTSNNSSFYSQHIQN